MLNFAISQGIIDISSVQGKREMMKKQKYLEKHPDKIWEAVIGIRIYRMKRKEEYSVREKQKMKSSK